MNGVELRNKQNYENDLQQNFQTTGISFKTKFVDLKNFHPTDNPFVDKMHDFDEGVIVYVLTAILHYFIMTKQYFKLHRLNYIKRFFNYGELQVGNKCGPLTFVVKKIRGKSTRTIKFRSSASETACFLKLLPLMIKNLVPKTDKVWQLLLKLVKLSDLLDLSEHNEHSLKLLQKAIQDHHSTFLRLFPKEHLRPKFHNLLHYPDLIRKMGPPKSNNCYAFEQKHKTLKAIARSTTSRKFLSFTVSKKIGFNNAKRLLEKVNPKQIEFTNTKMSNSMKQTQSLQFCKSVLEINNFEIKKVQFYDRVSFREQTYKPGFYVYDNNKFFKIKNIFKYESTYLLFLEEIKTLYSVNTTFHIIRSETKKNTVMDMRMLRSFPINSHSVNNFNYIKSKVF